MTNFRLYKLKEFADDNFKFNENGKNFSKLVKNKAEKREIARYEQFLRFPHCFKKDTYMYCKCRGLFGKVLRRHKQLPMLV